MAHRYWDSGIDFQSDHQPDEEKTLPANALSELCLSQQVALWSLRTYLQGPKQASKIYRQYEQALPATAARVAWRALEKIVQTLNRHGKASLKFYCLCKASLTADEVKLLAVLDSVGNGSPAVMSRAASGLVSDYGVEALITAMTEYLAAIEARRWDDDWRIPTATRFDVIH